MKKRIVSDAKRAYDAANPVIAFRVPSGDYTIFKDKVENIGMPMSEFIRRALTDYDEDVSNARSQGVRGGFARAKARYAVYVTCSGCGEPVALTDNGLKQKVGDDLFKNSYRPVVHEGCRPPAGFRLEDCDVMESEFGPRTKTVK